MFRVKLLCFDTPDCVTPYEDSPANDIQFSNFNKAYEYAKKLCLDEYLGLLEFNVGEDVFQKANCYSIIENTKDDGSLTIGVYFKAEPHDKWSQLTVYFVEEV